MDPHQGTNVSLLGDRHPVDSVQHLGTGPPAWARPQQRLCCRPDQPWAVLSAVPQHLQTSGLYLPGMAAWQTSMALLRCRALSAEPGALHCSHLLSTDWSKMDKVCHGSRVELIFLSSTSLSRQHADKAAWADMPGPPTSA